MTISRTKTEEGRHLSLTDPRQTVRELTQHFVVDGSNTSCHLNVIGKVKKLDPARTGRADAEAPQHLCFSKAAQSKGAFSGEDRTMRQKINPLRQSPSLCTMAGQE